MRLHYRDTRKADNAIVFVHGFPFHGGMWEGQLETLPHGWRGIAPDLRGFGLSGAPLRSGEPLTMERHADDIVALLDRLRIERAVFCGLSMGGYVLFALWNRHRERVRALVLCDTRAGADTEEMRRGRRVLAVRAEREGAGVVCESMLPRLMSDASRERLPEVETFVEAMILGTAPATLSAALHGLAARADSTSLLDTIDVPTLVMVGSDDVITPVAEAELIAERVHGARLAVIPGAGHMVNLEAAELFNAELAVLLNGSTAVL